MADPARSASWSALFFSFLVLQKEIQDVQYLAAMNPTAGSFTVDPRLQGLFATFSCLLPSKKNLSYVYTAVLEHHFSPFGSSVAELVPKLIKATIELHDWVSLKFIPSSRKFHYQFNLRDLSAVFQAARGRRRSSTDHRRRSRGEAQPRAEPLY